MKLFYEGKYREIIDKMKAPCDECEWFYLLEGMNHYICESKLQPAIEEHLNGVRESIGKDIWEEIEKDEEVY